jgi:hypothetical protein
MPAPTSQEMCRAKLIVRAEYKGFRKKGAKISYFDPPLANYRVDKVLQGKYDNPEISIRYDFHDGSACLEEKGWAFSDSLMPNKGSLWVLFIEENRTLFTTYRGEFGRIRAQADTGLEVCKKIPQVNNPTKVEPVSNDGRK